MRKRYLRIVSQYGYIDLISLDEGLQRLQTFIRPVDSNAIDGCHDVAVLQTQLIE